MDSCRSYGSAPLRKRRVVPRNGDRGGVTGGCSACHANGRGKGQKCAALRIFFKAGECSERNSLKVRSMKVLRLPGVCELTGVPRSTLYLYIKNNQFPKPIKLGIQSVGWIQEEVEQWLRQRMELRDAI